MNIFRYVRCFFLFSIAGIILAQQVADPNFDARVAHPAYIKNGPKVLFDEAHVLKATQQTNETALWDVQTLLKLGQAKGGLGRREGEGSRQARRQQAR